MQSPLFLFLLRHFVKQLSNCLYVAALAILDLSLVALLRYGLLHRYFSKDLQTLCGSYLVDPAFTENAYLLSTKS